MTYCLLDSNLKLMLTIEKKLNEMSHVLALCVNGQITRKRELLVTSSCYLELDQSFSNWVPLTFWVSQLFGVGELSCVEWNAEQPAWSLPTGCH